MTNMTASPSSSSRTSPGASAGARFAVLGLSILAGLAFIALLSVLLPADSWLAMVLTDRASLKFTYPFTIQNLMWILFFIGLGELAIRSLRAGRDMGMVSRRLLPEDDETMLRAQDLAPYAARAKQTLDKHDAFLQRLIVRIIWQFQSSRSVAQSTEILNASIELFQHEIDLRYNMVRYVTWLIPTLGFIGTVIGIAFALETAADPPDVSDAGALKPWMQELTTNLGVAFYTTLVALVQSAMLVFIMHIAQEREELALNRASQYCLDNLINRLYEK